MGFSLDFCNGDRLQVMCLPDRQKVWQYIHSFRHSTDTEPEGRTEVRRTDRRTELAKQYRALHALYADAR